MRCPCSGTNDHCFRCGGSGFYDPAGSEATGARGRSRAGRPTWPSGIPDESGGRADPTVFELDRSLGEYRPPPLSRPKPEPQKAAAQDPAKRNAGERNRTRNRRTAGPPKGPGTVACTICGRRCRGRAGLIVHELRKHPDSAGRHEEGELWRALLDARWIEQHATCPACDLPVASIGAWREHWQVACPANRSESGSGEVGTRSSRSKRRLDPSTRRKGWCRFCKYDFGLRSRLMLHELLHHPGIARAWSTKHLGAALADEGWFDRSSRCPACGEEVGGGAEWETHWEAACRAGRSRPRRRRKRRTRG